MRITIYHTSCTNGVPVILDDNGDVLPTAMGIKKLRQKLGLTAGEFGSICGYSEKTVNGWEQGKKPVVAALNMMQKILRGYALQG